MLRLVSMSRRRLLMAGAAMIGAGCRPGGSGAGDRPTPSTAPSTSGIVPLAAVELQSRVGAFLAAPDLNGAGLLAIDMGASGDVGWVPYLVDLVRLAGQAEGTEQVLGALQTLTGRYVLNDATVAFVEYGGWVLANRPQPAPGYLNWKRSLYGRIDPTFAVMLGGVTDPMLLSEIHWGGVLRGGIPDLDQPVRTVPGQPSADYLTEDELVFGLSVDGVAVAYPERIMGYHELANDVVNGADLVVSYCPLCRSARAHRAGGRIMQTSGLLRHSNKLMVARVGSGGSATVAPLAEAEPVLWQQQTGMALNGPQQGTLLEEVPIETRTWQQWRTHHPTTEVLALPERDRYPDQSYEYVPFGAYSDYDAESGAWFPVLAPPGNIPLKATVITLLGSALPATSGLAADVALAIDVDGLARAGPTIIAWPTPSSELILAIPETHGAQLYLATASTLAVGPLRSSVRVEPDRGVLADGSALPRLLAGRATWFSWYGEHPATLWWPA